MTKEIVEGNLIYSEKTGIPVDLTKRETFLSVTMSNQIVRSNQCLGIIEKRLIACCIAQITSEDRQRRNQLYINDFLQKRRFKVSADMFAKVFSYKHNRRAYKDLQDAAKSLFERSTHIKMEEQEEYARIVDRIKYEDGAVELFFTPDMYFYLFDISDGYIQYNLKVGAGFKSIYAHRVFELLQTRKDTNKIIISNKDLRFILNIPESYKTYAKIKEKVFTPAAKEFSKYGMTLEVEVIKSDKDSNQDIIVLKTNKNMNDIAKELGLTDENFLKQWANNKKNYGALGKEERQAVCKVLPEVDLDDASEEQIRQKINEL